MAHMPVDRHASENIPESNADQLDERETQERVEAALRGSKLVPRTQMKDIPRKRPYRLRKPKPAPAVYFPNYSVCRPNRAAWACGIEKMPVSNRSRPYFHDEEAFANVRLRLLRKLGATILIRT